MSLEFSDEYEDSLHEHDEAKRRRKMRRDRDIRAEDHEKRIFEIEPTSRRAGRRDDDHDDDESVADDDLRENVKGDDCQDRSDYDELDQRDDEDEYDD
jgi:hypothetical protein